MIEQLNQRVDPIQRKASDITEATKGTFLARLSEGWTVSSIHESIGFLTISLSHPSKKAQYWPIAGGSTIA